MFRFEIIGYNYGSGRDVSSTTVGYTYSGWSCVGSDSRRNEGDGKIGHYCTNDGYVVIIMSFGNTYYLGLTANAWFLNPTGGNHEIAVLETKRVAGGFSYQWGGSELDGGRR